MSEAWKLDNRTQRIIERFGFDLVEVVDLYNSAHVTSWYPDTLIYQKSVFENVSGLKNLGAKEFAIAHYLISPNKTNSLFSFGTVQWNDHQSNNSFANKKEYFLFDSYQQVDVDPQIIAYSIFKFV
jgi:hypothetical protein